MPACHSEARSHRSLRMGMLWLAGGILASASHGASADDATGTACRQKADSTYAIVQCQKATLAGVERRLNAAYAAALRALPDDQQAKLKTAERLWIGFRQKDCEVFYGKQTGTIASIQGGDCMIGHAETRIKDLMAITTP